MKRVIICYFAILLVFSARAENPAAVQIVKDFGENLSNWCKTKDIRYCDAMTDLTKGSKMCLVSDRILMETLPESNETWTLTSFVAFFQKHIHDGINVSFSQVKVEPILQMSSGEEESPTCISCEIELGGSVNLKSKDIFYVRGDKITAITDYGNTQRMHDAYKYYIEKRYKEAFDIFWDFVNNTKDEATRSIAEGFVFYMIRNNEGCQHIDRHIRNMFLANKVCSNIQFTGFNKWGLVEVYEHPSQVLAPKPTNRFYYNWENFHEMSLKPTFVEIGWKTNDNPFYYKLFKEPDFWEKNFVNNWIFFKKNDKLINYSPYSKKPSKHKPFSKEYYYYFNFFKNKYSLYAITPTVKKEEGYWGYVDEQGNIIGGTFKYLFAYPFDRKEGLALVKDVSGKWGYINSMGEYVIPPIYDMGQELFSNGKTFVIKDHQLIQIDVEGNELMSIPGYSDMVVSPDSKHFVAYNYEKGDSYDIFDYSGKIKYSYYDVGWGVMAEMRTGLKLESKYATDFKKWVVMTSNGRIIRNVPELTIVERGYMGSLWISCSMLDDTNAIDYHKHVYMDEHITNPESIGAVRIVDLGLSVKWAAWNIGANAPEEEGLHCGWGDPTGIDQTGKEFKKWKKEVVDPKTNKWISQSYGGANPPANICGTSLDVARKQWGNGWRLPSVKEFQELAEKCKWEKVIYKGVDGYLITGSTGNRIFMKSMDWTGYWTGELNPKWNNGAIMFRDGKIEGRYLISRAGGIDDSWSDERFRPCVRAVYE